eukprot:1539669-Rhodomonas_salina.2
MQRVTVSHAIAKLNATRHRLRLRLTEAGRPGEEEGLAAASNFLPDPPSGPCSSNVASGSARAAAGR